MLFKKCTAPAVAGAPRARAEQQSSSSDRNQSHLSESGVYLQLQQFWQLSIQPVQWDGAARHCDTQDRDQGSSRGATRTLCLSDNKLVKIVRSHFRGGEFPSPQLWMSTHESENIFWSKTK